MVGHLYDIPVVALLHTLLYGVYGSRTIATHLRTEFFKQDVMVILFIIPVVCSHIERRSIVGGISVAVGRQVHRYRNLYSFSHYIRWYGKSDRVTLKALQRLFYLS